MTSSAGIFRDTYFALDSLEAVLPLEGIMMVSPGLHNLFHPTIRDGSMWSKFRAHGDVFLFLRCALILRELNLIFIAYLFKGSQEQSGFLQTPLFTAFLVTVLKILTYALVST